MPGQAFYTVANNLAKFPSCLQYVDVKANMKHVFLMDLKTTTSSAIPSRQVRLSRGSSGCGFLVRSKWMNIEK